MFSLTFITSLLGIIAQKTGLSLALLNRYFDEHRGANMPLIVMALLTLGWFSSITGVVGQTWGSLIGNPTGIVILLNRN